MQQLIRTLTLLIVVCACAIPLHANSDTGRATDQRAGAPLLSDAPPVFPAPPVRNDPFDLLFEPTGPHHPLPSSLEQPESGQRPKVVCGILVIPADPSVDPRIQVEPPTRDTQFTIRAIQPSLCWPE